MPYLYIYIISPFKIVVIWFTSEFQTFKIPKKYDFFSKNTKISYRFDCKVGRNCHKSCGLNVLRS